MPEISIRTFAIVTEIINPFLGSSIEPIYMQIEIQNISQRVLHINKVCVSVKTFFWGSDIIPSAIRYTINPGDTQAINFDVQYLIRNYSRNKKFTIKVYVEESGKSYESEVLLVRQFVLG